MFVTSIIMAILAIIAIAFAIGLARAADRAETDYDRDGWLVGGLVARIASGVFLILTALFFFLGSFFTQDPGESNVLRDWSGAIVGQESTPGFHWKAPWVDTITFDIRNQRVVYTGGDSVGDNSGGSADGPQITVQDASGVTANLDIAVRYSIKSDAVIDIYNQYLNADNLKSRLIFNDIRSVVRSVPGSFTTIELLTNRNDVQAAILKALEKRWEDDGIVVEDVALQEIRYAETVTTAFAEAQAARTAVETAEANLERAKVDAQVRVAEAQAQADANALLTASLTPQILQQRYIDALKQGTVYVVPSGSVPFIGTR